MTEVTFKRVTHITQFNMTIFTATYILQLFMSKYNLLTNKLYIAFVFSFLTSMLVFNKFAYRHFYLRGYYLLESERELKDLSNIDVNPCVRACYKTTRYLKYFDDCVIAYCMLFILATVIYMTSLSKNSNTALFGFTCCRLGAPVFIMAFIYYMFSYRAFRIECKKVDLNIDEVKEG